MTEARLAVLIDADNAQAAIIGNLLAEIAKFGVATARRIYGDFTSPQLASWRDALLTHSIQPIQQFRNTVGKNATDSALIIDAMDLLHSGKLDGFCIVSSDGDFTRLAARIREEGLAVYGFGEQKTPKSFVSACDRFIYTEILRPAAPKAAAPAQKPKPPKPPVALLREAVETSADDEGWAFLGAVGQLILKTAPDFDPRTYGHAKLGELVAATGAFELDRQSKTGGSAVLRVRLKS